MSAMGRFVSGLLAASVTMAVALPLQAQVGRTAGMLDPNLATEAELTAVPNVTPALAKTILEKRPFLKTSDFLAVFAGLTKEQQGETYAKLWLHLNLNSATDEEILAVPGIGNRMLREFKEYRPYKALAQFKREMGKYVKPEEVDRMAGYVFVPVDLNSASDEDILSIPGIGNRMLREFKEYRPYKAIEQFRREMGKYVKPGEVARMERYVEVK